MTEQQQQQQQQQQMEKLGEDGQTQTNNINTSTLDPTIVEAMMTGTIRDKQILLLAESEMGKFLASNLQRQSLSSSFSTSLNSYQRMLVHRLGDSFGIKRLVESNHIIMEKTPTSACLNIRLESLIVRQDASPSNTDANLTSTNSSSALSISTSSSDKIEPSSSSSPSCSNTNPANSSTSQPKTFKIMSRTLSQSSRPTNRNLMPSTASSGSSTDGSISESKRNELSYEERQAAYLEARNRIFANANNSSIENSTGESTAGSTSSSGAGPEEDRFSATTSNSKSKSQSESLSTDGGPSTEPNTKDKPDSTRSNKPAAKLRPSATSFDPNAKAHGYEEVTIIEVDNQSITVPYQASNKLYPNYLAHPTAEYPNPFPSDPRLPPNHYKTFPNHSYPPLGSATSHPPYPVLSHHLSGMGPPPLPVHMAPPGVPPPFIQPPYPTVGEPNSPTVPTIVGAVPPPPPPPIPPIQPNSGNIIPPDHKYCPNNNNNQPFKDYRNPESGYNPNLHTMRPHPTHPPTSDSSSHQPLGPTPSQYPVPLPPPPQHHQHHQHPQQPPHQQQHIPFSGPPPNGFVPDSKNFHHAPPFPPHDTQSPHPHPNLGMGGGYPRQGPPHGDMVNHPPPSNGFSTWSSNPSIPPPPSNHFQPTPPPPNHHHAEQFGISPAPTGVQNGNGTLDHQTVHTNRDTTSSTAATTTTTTPAIQSNCGSSISSSSCSTTGNSSSCSSFQAPATMTRHPQQQQHAPNGHLVNLNKTLERLNLNHNRVQNRKNHHHIVGNKNLNKNHHHHQNGNHHHRPSTTTTTTTTSSNDMNINLNNNPPILLHPLPPKPVWNLKNHINHHHPIHPSSPSSLPLNESSNSPSDSNSNNILR